MKAHTNHNPHQERFEPFNIVVFGGDGDLSIRKILPAIFHRDLDGQLNTLPLPEENPISKRFTKSSFLS
jgi:hypothetical protein